MSKHEDWNLQRTFRDCHQKSQLQVHDCLKNESVAVRWTGVGSIVNIALASYIYTYSKPLNAEIR